MLLESAGVPELGVLRPEKTFDPSEFSVEVINEERIEVVFQTKASQNIHKM